MERSAERGMRTDGERHPHLELFGALGQQPIEVVRLRPLRRNYSTMDDEDEPDKAISNKHIN
ncbi:hypothetical protein DVH21_30025 [Micromonospora aurantiaca]|uniref:Uncharacterized protein n=1 Tax=Micromonospora aurantiaca (nom. illeg.) TaxID=47850 RepID=A0A6N3K7Z3_9ACTN|nr:hypothetical protein DVH21_30025 [Micromonospora aurantiaca]